MQTRYLLTTIIILKRIFPQLRERIFRTLQDRLVKELRLLGITGMEEANRYLKEQFIPAYNQQFAVVPEESGSTFVPWVGLSLWDIFCIQEERVVNKDNTVSYQNKKLQIPADQQV